MQQHGGVRRRGRGAVVPTLEPTGWVVEEEDARGKQDVHHRHVDVDDDDDGAWLVTAFAPSGGGEASPLTPRSDSHASPLTPRSDSHEEDPREPVRSSLLRGMWATVCRVAGSVYAALPSWESFRRLLRQRAASDLVLDPTTLQRMSVFKDFIEPQYDPTNECHVAVLAAYWDASIAADQPFLPVTKAWGRLGFQGKDPSTDFRGAGLFGLCNLLYFARAYPIQFRGLQRGSSGSAIGHNHHYPFSISGLTITMLIFQLLGWGFKPVPTSFEAREALVRLLFGHDNNWRFTTAPVGTVAPEARALMLEQGCEDAEEGGDHDYSLLADDDVLRLLHPSPQPGYDCAFEELYCLCFWSLDQEWYAARATYMDFPAVMERASQRVQALLPRLLTVDHIRELNQAHERAFV